ncbi:uncharacterized protein LOC129773058 [Toxorhynchites rutilus septentrionalis]|uniref:uncharacterized protein LOC129773058 n=1 Tax=Toxorhynchites rutilus septentrionalis TaxID=329112 RepID=UPI00247ABC90|nr:uncharacterized protein LOC129773058 [Toxorhynchites rutilus septentrionalis]
MNRCRQPRRSARRVRRSRSRNSAVKEEETGDEDTQLIIELSEDGSVEVISENLRILQDSEQGVGTERNITYYPLPATIYDGTYRHDRLGSPESEGTFTAEGAASKASGEWEPVVTEDGLEGGNDRSISIAGRVEGHAVGAIVEGSTTILLQLSTSEASARYQRVADWLREVNEMLGNDESGESVCHDDEGSPCSAEQEIMNRRKATRRMREVTMDILERVQGTPRESTLMKLQTTLEEILDYLGDKIVVHSHSRLNPVTASAARTEGIVGYYGDGDETAILVQPVRSTDPVGQGFASRSDGDRISVDLLEGFLRESMVSQENIIEQTLSTEPHVTAFASGERIVGVLSFPNTSSGAVITSSKSLQEMDSKTLTEQFRKLVHESYQKLLVQAHSKAECSGFIEQIKQELDQSLVNNGAGCSTIIQTVSKNWIKTKSNASPADLVHDLRMLIEQFILNNVLDERDMKCIAATIGQVFHSEQKTLSYEFKSSTVLDKIRTITQQLMNPSEDENHLLIINQIRETLEDIVRCQMTGKRPTDYRPWDVLRTFFEGIIFNSNAEPDSDSVIYALRDGLLDIFVKHETSQRALFEILKKFPTGEGTSRPPLTPLRSCPGVTLLTDHNTHQNASSEVLETPSSVEIVQKVHDLSSPDEPTGHGAGSILALMQALLLTFLRIIGSWSRELISLLDPKPSADLQPERSHSRSLNEKPSVSFNLLPGPADDETPSDSPQPEADSQGPNDAIDELRQLLLKSSLNGGTTPKRDAVPHCSLASSGPSKDLPSSRERMSAMLSKVLKESGAFKVTKRSPNTFHFELESISGDCVWSEDGGECAAFHGSVYDHEEGRALVFKTRTIVAESVSKVESQIECVQEVRKLSDDDGIGSGDCGLPSGESLE